ncbi:MAG: DUF5715 family protein [Rubricoccaceae bacterium]|nr:DUF5715 family protein [Rubricoccaceae bacterium]
MSDVLSPPRPAAAPAPPPEPPRRLPKKRLAVGLLLLLTVPALLLYGSHLGSTQETYAEEVSDWLASFEARFEAIPLLTEEEEALLRRSRNARHVALAESLGTPPIASKDSLQSIAEARGLVSVSESNPTVALAEADFSIGWLTPSAAASLDSIGARFHARLREAGLPLYRVVATSLLRSTEDQAALRGQNVNAAAGHSSHEYGTTYDLHYRRFAYGSPGELAPPEPPELLFDLGEAAMREAAARRTDDAFAGYAETYPSRLAALLGRVLIELEDAGVLVTVMERRQPVFHTTVARDLVGTGTIQGR